MNKESLLHCQHWGRAKASELLLALQVTLSVLERVPDKFEGDDQERDCSVLEWKVLANLTISGEMILGPAGSYVLAARDTEMPLPPGTCQR